jgi:hypothetical protein
MRVPTAFWFYKNLKLTLNLGERMIVSMYMEFEAQNDFFFIQGYVWIQNIIILSLFQYTYSSVKYITKYHHQKIHVWRSIQIK